MLETLKDSVTKILINDYDMLIEEAEEKVQESVSSDPDMWNENAEASDLARYLASDEVDD